MRHALIATVAAAAVSLSALAAGPTTAPAVKPPAKMTPETTATHIQHLRAIRRTLNQLRGELKAEPIVVSDAHRTAPLKALEQSIDAVNAEVIDLEKKAK